MQYRHPMQRCQSIMTMPSSLFHVARVGQTRTQGGLSQWLQKRGTRVSLNAAAWYSFCSEGKELLKEAFQPHSIR